MSYLFTSESVSEGHPDKVADQISDALLDQFLRWDPESKVGCETFVTTGLVHCGGEVRTNGWVDIQETVRAVIKKIGYTKAEYQFDADSCGIISTIHEQSKDIRQGVVREKPEDQVNIVLLGSDTRPNEDEFQTDAIIWVSLNPNNGFVSIVILSARRIMI